MVESAYPSIIRIQSHSSIHEMKSNIRLTNMNYSLFPLLVWRLESKNTTESNPQESDFKFQH